MPTGSFKQIEVQCPFYKYDVPKRITCEGLIDKSNISMGFLVWKDYEIHIKTFCAQHYQNCEVYRMLMEAKYDEEEC